MASIDAFKIAKAYFDRGSREPDIMAIDIAGTEDEIVVTVVRNRKPAAGANVRSDTEPSGCLANVRCVACNGLGFVG